MLIITMLKLWMLASPIRDNSQRRRDTKKSITGMGMLLWSTQSRAGTHHAEGRSTAKRRYKLFK